MPNFIKVGQTGACRRYGRKYTSRIIFYIYGGDFSTASAEKILNNFKRLMILNVLLSAT